MGQLVNLGEERVKRCGTEESPRRILELSGKNQPHDFFKGLHHPWKTKVNAIIDWSRFMGQIVPEKVKIAVASIAWDLIEIGRAEVDSPHIRRLDHAVRNGRWFEDRRSIFGSDQFRKLDRWAWKSLRRAMERNQVPQLEEFERALARDMLTLIGMYTLLPADTLDLEEVGAKEDRPQSFDLADGALFGGLQHENLEVVKSTLWLFRMPGTERMIRAHARKIVRAITPLVGHGSARKFDQFLLEHVDRVKSEKYSPATLEQTLGNERFTLLREWMRQRLLVLYGRADSPTQKRVRKFLFEVSCELAMLVLRPEDIDNLPSELLGT